MNVRSIHGLFVFIPFSLLYISDNHLGTLVNSCRHDKSRPVYLLALDKTPQQFFLGKKQNKPQGRRWSNAHMDGPDATFNAHLFSAIDHYPHLDPRLVF